MRQNPFLEEHEAHADRNAERVKALLAQYENEIQALDEEELAAEALPRNRFLNRIIPGREALRAAEFAQTRDHKMYELGRSLAKIDHEAFGVENRSEAAGMGADRVDEIATDYPERDR